MKRRGYMLIETVVAMTVLSVTILAVHRGISQALTARARTMDFTVARFLMEEKLSDLEMQPMIVEGQGEGAFPPPHERFHFSWKVKKIDLPNVPIPPTLDPARAKLVTGGLAKHMGKIEIAISWERSRQKFERTGETLIRTNESGGTSLSAELWVPKEKEGAP